MRLIRNLGIISIVLLACNSCFKAPEYPVIPQITFSDIYFGAAKTSKQTDSLVLSLNFKDGDGDLGLSDADSTNFEYINGYYFIINSSKQVLFADKPNYTLS